MNTAQKASEEINEILIRHLPNMTNSAHIVLKLELLQVVERAICNYSEDIKRAILK